MRAKLSADQPLGSLNNRTPTDFEVETLIPYLEFQREILERCHVVAAVSDRRLVEAIDFRRQCGEIYGKKQRTRDRALWNPDSKSHDL